jgi:pyruvate ferredoxin oxidoreductase delta subunit
MAFIDENEKCIFETEASWSDANKTLMCLRTDSWRTERPVVISEKCNRCGFCYIYCPTQCIRPDQAMENYVIDLEFCKGCGLCAAECPKDAISMTPEGEFKNDGTSK